MIAKMIGNRSNWLPVLIRIGAGLTFLFAGLPKLITGSVPFFTQLGIPAPGIAAPFIGVVETVGGIALLLGLGTRFFSILLVCDMLVAIFVAKLPGPQGLLTLGLPNGWNAVRVETLLLLSALGLALGGPGKPSIDLNVIKRELP